jgi:MFS family permease
VIGGIGAGAISTCSMAVISSFDKQEREKYIGWIEVGSGMGFVCGPLVGSLMYEIGGFSLPFLFFGSLILISLPLV